MSEDKKKEPVKKDTKVKPADSSKKDSLGKGNTKPTSNEFSDYEIVQDKATSAYKIADELVSRKIAPGVYEAVNKLTDVVYDIAETAQLVNESLAGTKLPNAISMLDAINESLRWARSGGNGASARQLRRLAEHAHAAKYSTELRQIATLMLSGSTPLMSRLNSIQEGFNIVSDISMYVEKYLLVESYQDALRGLVEIILGKDPKAADDAMKAVAGIRTYVDMVMRQVADPVGVNVLFRSDTNSIVGMGVGQFTHYTTHENTSDNEMLNKAASTANHMYKSLVMQVKKRESRQGIEEIVMAIIEEIERWKTKHSAAGYDQQAHPDPTPAEGTPPADGTPPASGTPPGKGTPPPSGQ